MLQKSNVQLNVLSNDIPGHLFLISTLENQFLIHFE